MSAISIAVSPYFHFLMRFCSVLNGMVSSSIVMPYWMESIFAVYYIFLQRKLYFMYAMMKGVEINVV